MPVRINSFGGPITWILRKHCSGLTSKIALTFAAAKYDRDIRKYIDYCSNCEEMPLFMNCMIETVNRCNGSCSFCPANKNEETRPFKKMSDEMFESIINELSEMGWQGNIFLSINNEPFIDKRILDFAEYAKKNLPDSTIELITNGTLLTVEKLYEIVNRLDRITINDYSDKYRLSETHRSIYREMRINPDAFRNLEVIINRRYDKEILATRAGYAPNKKEKNNSVNGPCIYPFMDILIYPDGKVGMCCNDCKEISDFGDITQNSLKEIWNNNKFSGLRNAMKTGDRRNYLFCKECDVVDAGGREKKIKGELSKYMK